MDNSNAFGSTPSVPLKEDIRFILSYSEVGDDQTEPAYCGTDITEVFDIILECCKGRRNNSLYITIHMVVGSKILPVYGTVKVPGFNKYLYGPEAWFTFHHNTDRHTFETWLKYAIEAHMEVYQEYKDFIQSADQTSQPPENTQAALAIAVVGDPPMFRIDILPQSLRLIAYPDDRQPTSTVIDLYEGSAATLEGTFSGVRRLTRKVQSFYSEHFFNVDFSEIVLPHLIVTALKSVPGGVDPNEELILYSGEFGVVRLYRQKLTFFYPDESAIPPGYFDLPFDSLAPNLLWICVSRFLLSQSIFSDKDTEIVLTHMFHYSLDYLKKH